LNSLVDLDETFYGGDANVREPRSDNFESHSFNHFKVVEIRFCVVDALPTPFSLAQQWVGIAYHCWGSMVSAHTVFS
jgi:hypothetical protein